MADLSSNFHRHQIAQPVLAGLGPTDGQASTTSNARLRPVGAAWCGRRWAPKGRPSSTSSGPRYGAIWGADRRLLGLNNIELITDRPLEVNLREIKEVKRKWKDRALGDFADGARARKDYWQDNPETDRGYRGRRGGIELSAARMAWPNAAWDRPWGRCRNISRWSRAGSRSTAACPASSS